MVRLLSALGDRSPGVQRLLGGVGFWPLSQHLLCTRVAYLGEMMGGEVLPSHGDFPS